MRKNSAVTFIELLVVIIIIGILVGISIPQLRKTFDNFQLDNFAKDIYYLCQYLQASAISQGKVYSLNINPAEGALQAFYKDGNNNLQQAEGRFGKIYMAPRGVILSSLKDVLIIYFYPDGSTSEIEITFENNHGHKVSLKAKGASGGIKIE